jgi:hypothetical protein
MASIAIDTDTALYGLYFDLAIAERDADRFELYEKFAKFDEAVSRIETITEAIAPLEALFHANKWARFHIVANANGHIHKSVNCVTCYDSTEFSWLPQVSGMTDEEVIELAGEKACTICFPNAPVTDRPSKLDTVERMAAKAEREAKAIAKAAEMDVKGIKAIDGSELRYVAGFDKGRVIKTERGATNAISSDMNSMIHYGTDHPFYSDWLANVTHLVKAVAAKRGVDSDALYNEFYAKAEKKVAADIRKYSK